MKPNRWIELSRRIYARLLFLYPQEHRVDYGESMLQLFNDQCNSACEQRGAMGIVLLWLRTLFDLGATALSEHLASPEVKWGLLDARPNKPLPWKGVVLVLIPGVIFFISQLAQLNGENWFFTAVSRAGYLLMAPVLLVWLFTRKYPVWGLIPLGMLFKSLVDAGNRLVMGLVYQSDPMFTVLYSLGSANGLSSGLTSFLMRMFPGLTLGIQSLYVRIMYHGESIWLGSMLAFVIVLFAWLYHRRQRTSPTAWVFWGTYLLLAVVQVQLNVQNFLELGNWTIINNPAVTWNIPVSISNTATQIMQQIRFWTLYGSATFLLMIFLGMLLARRYGDLAILFPLGYLLGGVVYGLYGTDFGNEVLYLIMGVVLVYRILIALVAPVWISRSTGRGRLWAVVIPVGLAFTAQVLLNQVMVDYFYRIVSYNYFYNTYDPVPLVNRLTMIVDPLVVAVGLALALALYRPGIPEPAVEETPSAALGTGVPE